MTSDGAVVKNKISKAEIIRKLCAVGLFLSALCLVGSAGWRSQRAIAYDAQTSSLVKVIRNHNDVQVVGQQLDALIEQAQANHWTAGYTSAFINSEDENLGLWYSNLLAARERIRAVENKDATKSEVALTMMSVQQDFGSARQNVQDGPDGISMFPHNRSVSIAMWASLVLGILFLIGWNVADNHCPWRGRYDGRFYG